jgi:hypothetical protein
MLLSDVHQLARRNHDSPAHRSLDPQGHRCGQAGSATTELAFYHLLSVRNDLHIAEFFEPVFAEFNSNP